MNFSQETRYKGYHQRGYTLAGALVLIAVLSIFMAMALPFWEKVKQREMEEELIFRGKEYTEAIGRYHAKFNSYPPDLETLEKQKFIRKLYKDPMTESGKWKVLRPDSLVETGEAGAINQPGQQGGLPRQGENEEGEEPEEAQIPQSPQRTESENSDDQAQQEQNGEEDQGEEPESEVVGPVAGVVSRSKKTSMRVYNGQAAYNKWVFTFTAPQQQQEDRPGGKDSKSKPDPKKPEKPKKGKPQNPNQQQD